MFVLSNFLTALAGLVGMIFQLYIFIVIARALMSWVNPDPYNPVVRFLIQVTEPALSRIRRVVPPMGGMDLSPMILILALVFLQSFIVPTLHHLAAGM